MLERSGSLDEMTVEVEPAADALDGSAAAAGLRARIKTLVGISAIVRVVPRGTIEPSAGKARRVYDRRSERRDA